MPSNYISLRTFLLYFRHTDSRVSWSHLHLTYCLHSLHRQTLLPVGCHAAPLPFGTVFPHSYALLTASLVLSRSYMFARHFVAGVLSAPLIPMLSFSRVTNSLLTSVTFFSVCRCSIFICPITDESNVVNVVSLFRIFGITLFLKCWQNVLILDQNWLVMNCDEQDSVFQLSG